MKNRIKSLWLLAVTIAFSLYLFGTPMAMAAPKESVSQNGIQDERATVSQNGTQNNKAAASQNNVQDSAADDGADMVSTADEFTAWLASHQNGGGRVKLTNNIVLKEYYFFSPNGADLPDIIVDTDVYTITAAGNIHFLSDGHLIFQGKAGSEGIFHVAKGGMLTLDGVIVEGTVQGSSPQYALWQEEGAGLLLGNTYTACKVSGEIHYADTALVTKAPAACVVVERGGSAEGRLPTQIECNVNYQGQIQDNKLVPISWNLAGTEKQQEERRRFQVEGFSSQAFFEVPPVCTVVYNDYPLTFTKVEAFIRSGAYYFQGEYTKSQKELPMIVAAEYSFDGKNWIVHSEDTVTNINTSFTIYFPCEDWDAEQNPYVYIRLRGVKNDNTFYSNVLRYKAGNMNNVGDLGGNRGGGTSVVNPPDAPKGDSSDTSSGNQKPSDEKKPSGGQNSSDDHKSSDEKNPSDDHKSSDDYNSSDEKNPSGDHNSSDDQHSSDEHNPSQDTSSENNSSDGNQDVNRVPDQGITQNIADNSASLDNGVPGNVDGSNDSAAAISENRNDENMTAHTSPASQADTVPGETVEVMSKELAASAYEGDDKDGAKRQQMTVNQRLHTTRNMVLVLGFVTLSAGAGVAGYFVHTSSLRRHKQSKSASWKNRHKKAKSAKKR